MNFSESDIATLHAVAGFFGCNLTSENEGWGYTLPVCSAFSLYVRVDWQTKKARFSPVLPEGVHNHGSISSIKVSLQRPALAIAKDIQRRLIPEATEWAQKCRDYTAAEKRKKQAEADYLARIFAANRSTPEYMHHGNGWKGKGLRIDRYNTSPTHWGEHIAEVRVRSIQALEQIAAICAADFEFHHKGKEKSR